MESAVRRRQWRSLLWLQEWRPIEMVRQAVDNEDDDRETDRKKQELKGGFGTKHLCFISGVSENPGRGRAKQEYQSCSCQRGDDRCHGLSIRAVNPFGLWLRGKASMASV